MRRLSAKALGDGAFEVGRANVKVVVNAHDKREALKVGRRKLEQDGKLDAVRKAPRLIDRKPA